MPRFHHVRRLTLVALPLLVTACGNSTSPPAAKSSSTVAATTSTTVPSITSATVVIDGKSVTVPRDDSGAPISSMVDTGQQVIITAKGFLPAVLYSQLKTPVVFTNLTSKTVDLTMTFRAGPPLVVAPGASVSVVPTALQFQARTANGLKDKVVVGAFED